MNEFRSHLENLMLAEELLFDATLGYGTYKVFLEHAMAHPAKMNTKLLEFLIETFTTPGDTILDPMGGSGSTGVVAALNGRNAVCVDLEEKFYKWMEKTRKKLERQKTFTVKGSIKNVCGDARKLSELLKDVDVIVTSPPFSETISKSGGPTPYKKIGISSKTARQYSGNPENIGNLPHGKIDAIVTSPPYAEQIHSAGQPREKVIEILRKKGYDEKWIRAHYMSPFCNVKVTENEGYSKSDENIGNLPFDAVITSPPYEGSLEGTTRHTKGGIASRDPALAQSGTYATVLSKATKQGVPVGYSASPKNIGNLKKETYLEAMLTVYREMHKVLKPNGKAIVVIKPFIRNKKVVDLPYHTWLLLKKARFKLVKLFKLRLKTQSFWRILYSKKFPKVPKIKHEYVLVAQKYALYGGKTQ